MAQLKLHATFENYQALSRKLGQEARTFTIFKQAGLNELAYQRLGELLQEQTLQANERLTPNALYFVTEGAIDIERANDIAGSLTTNESHGEKYLLEVQPAQEMLIARTQTRVVYLDGPAYDQFAKEFSESAFALQAVLARRVLQELKKAQTNLHLLFETFKSIG